MKRSSLLRLPALTALLVLASALPAICGVITVTLDQSTRSGLPGDTLTFNGSIFNSSQEIVDLNASGITLTGSFTPDEAPFLSNVPLSLNPGSGMESSVALFTILINPDWFAASGPYIGTFTVLGGLEGQLGYDPEAQNVLDTVNFTVYVETPFQSQVPEPATMLLSAAGIAALLITRRKRA